MFDDLRGFIQVVQDLGECKTVEGAEWDLEIGTISELQLSLPNPPLLLFDNIKGYPYGYRVATNLFVTPKRTALGLGLPPEARGIELVRAMRDKIKVESKPLTPVEVETGPVKENIQLGDEVDLFAFPAPKWHELDGGRYIGTGAMGITRDPDEGWVNLGVYRVQIHDKNTATVLIGAGQHGDIIRRKYWAKGLGCPVAVTCGQDPMLWAAASWSVPWGISEYDIAGGWRGEPIKVTKGVTTDLPIPATAEIVLEGTMLPPEVESRMEGPFGEWSGYYGGGLKEAAFKVTSILYRNNPIIQGNPPSRLSAVWSLGRHIEKAAHLWKELDQQIPGVKGVWVVDEASVHAMPVISIEQRYGGHAKQAALLAAGSRVTGWDSTFIIVVDEDIDPSNISELLWALGTRVDPKTSIDIIQGCWRDDSPILPLEKRRRGETTMSRAIVIACKPYEWINDVPPAVKSSSELLRKTRDKWAKLF